MAVMKSMHADGGLPGRGALTTGAMMRLDLRAERHSASLAAEPHRLFFPLGVMAGITGVMVFPFFFAKWMAVYPMELHPRMMIHGFAGAFITGFLGTASPKFLGTRVLTLPEVSGLAALWLAGCVLLFFPSEMRHAEWCFAAQQGMMLLGFAWRMPRAKDVPPPGFVVAMGAVLLCIHFLVVPSAFGKVYVRQAYWLLPMVGVGSYLVPRFFVKGMPKQSKTARRVMLGVVCVAVLASVGWESRGGVSGANALRAGALTWWCLFVMPGGWPRTEGTRGFVLKCSLWVLPLGYLARALWPGPAFAMEHIVFISGLGSVMLLVGDRVSIGHGRDPRVSGGRSVFWRWIFWLTLLVMLTRVSADLIPKVLVSHYIYAAVLWAGLAVAWAWYHARHWRK